MFRIYCSYLPCSICGSRPVVTASYRNGNVNWKVRFFIRVNLPHTRLSLFSCLSFTASLNLYQIPKKKGHIVFLKYSPSWGLRSSTILRNADWKLVAGVSEQPIGHTLKTLGDGNDGLPPNDSNYQSTKQSRPHLHGGGSLKSRFVLIIVSVTIRTKNIRKTTKNFRKIYTFFFFQ
jgi:hypothetical protein